MRELSLTKNELIHPQTINGKRLMIDPEVQDLVDRLHNGDPTLGWEGDPRLALTGGRDPVTGENYWELVRFENGQYNLVATSRPGMKLDRSLIMHLVAHDLRRRSMESITDEIDRHNDAITDPEKNGGAEKLADALEKVYWAANRDIGHHY